MKKFILKNKVGIVGIIFLILFQSTMYMGSKLFQGIPIVIGNSLDSKIPFISYFIYVYIFWYIMLFFVPLFVYIKDKDVYYKYFSTYVISVLVSSIIFILYPTTIVRPSIISNNFTNYIVNLIYSFDEPILNCLPSLHCLISFLFIYASFNCNSIKINHKLIITFCSLLVVVSTLLIKQHVIIDVVLALVISVIVWIIVSKSKIYLKIKNRIE